MGAPDVLTSAGEATVSRFPRDAAQYHAHVGVPVILLKHNVARLKLVLGHSVRPPLHLLVRRACNDER